MVKRGRHKNGKKGMTGALCPVSKLVLDTATGIFYDSITEAAFAKNMDKSYLSSKLSGSRKNKTSFIYA